MFALPTDPPLTPPVFPLHPTVAGPADGRPIVFLHGMALTRTMWAPQMEALADEFRVISLDLPGHGELAGMRYSLDGACEVVAEAIRLAGGPTILSGSGGTGGSPVGGADESADRSGDLSYRKPVIVGLSMGGYTALEFAHRHPEMTAGLVLASCSAEGRGPLAFPYHAAAWLSARPTVRWLDWLNLLFIRLTVRKPYREPMLLGGSYSAATPEVVQGITTQDWASKLAEYPGPVLILNGQLDLAFRKDEKRWRAAAQHGRLQVIPWAGHLSNMHRPGKFTEAVRGFAEELGSAKSE